MKFEIGQIKKKLSKFEKNKLYEILVSRTRQEFFETVVQQFQQETFEPAGSFNHKCQSPCYECASSLLPAVNVYSLRSYRTWTGARSFHIIKGRRK